MTKRDTRTKHHITAMPSPYIYYSYLIYRKRNGTIQFLHPSLYFMSLLAVIKACRALDKLGKDFILY